MGQLAIGLMAALLLQAPMPKAPTGAAPSGQTAAQANSSGVPATPPATTLESTPQAGATSQPMSSEEADAAVDKLRQALTESMRNGRGPRELNPETQKAIADAAQQFLADPAIKGAIAEKIHQFPFSQRGQAEQIGENVLIPISFFALIALWVWWHYRSKQARLRAQMDAQVQLLGKFASGTELAAFLASPGGQQFLGGMGSLQMNPRSRVLKHVGIGAVLATLGFGMLFSGHGPSFAGVVVLSIGIGFLVSAAASYSLSKKMGLLNGEAKGPSATTPPPLQ